MDYWDYLGWKDTLAESRFSARQKAYSSMRGDRDVYTPQAIVNGSVHVLGSDQAGIEHPGHKPRSNALNFMRPRLSATQHRAISWLHGNCLELRFAPLDVACDTRQSAACPDS